MKIQVVLSEVGENTGVEVDPVHAILLQGMGADFHGYPSTTVSGHARQPRLKFRAFGGGMAGWTLVHAIVIEHGSDESGSSPRRLNQVMKEKGHGGLAIGSGHAGHAQGAAGMPVKGSSQLRHGAPRFRRPQPSHASAVRRSGRENPHGPGLDGLINKSCAIGLFPRQRAIDKSWADQSRVMGHPMHVHIPRPGGGESAHGGKQIG